MFSNGAKLAAASVAVASIISIGGASAASFSLPSVVSTGVTFETLQSNFNPGGWTSPDGIGATTPVVVFANGSTGGLSVTGATANTLMTFTYLGSEAAYTNQAFTGATQLFQNHGPELAYNTVFPTSFSVGNGIVPFSFFSIGAGNVSAVNGGTINQNLLLAFTVVGSRAYAFLEDIAIGGDRDLDDLVVAIDLSERPTPNGGPGPTPIPGAAWLFGSAVAGAAGIGRWRRRRNAAKT